MNATGRPLTSTAPCSRQPLTVLPPTAQGPESEGTTGHPWASRAQVSDQALSPGTLLRGTLHRRMQSMIPFGKYILYCPAFNIVWGESKWIGKGELWVKMCPDEPQALMSHDLYGEQFIEPAHWSYEPSDKRRIDLCVNCLRPINLVIPTKYYNEWLGVDYMWFHVKGGSTCDAFLATWSLGDKRPPGYTPDKAEPLRW